MHDTRPAATIPPSICGMSKRAPRTFGRVPVITIPNVTCVAVSEFADYGGGEVGRTAGLKRPPETLKKTQAVTAREKPKARLMNVSCWIEGASGGVRVLAIWVAAKA